MKPKILDLFCGAGGAAMGYHRAGFDVIGIDINPQPRYPFQFIQEDVLKMGALSGDFLAEFDAYHASPPCQAYTLAQRIRKREHPDLIEATRRLLQRQFTWIHPSGNRRQKPYIIENVEGSPLNDPVLLCGAMFPGLRVYRHCLFETSFPVPAPPHPEHVAPLRKMGRAPREGEFMHVVGNFSGVQRGRDAMGIEWMTRNELRESIPPAYTEYIGTHLMRHIKETGS